MSAALSIPFPNTHRLLRSTDRDEVATAAANVFHPLTIDYASQRRAFEFDLHAAALHDLELTWQRVDYEDPLVVRSAPSEDYYLLHLHTRGGAVMSYGATRATCIPGRQGVILSTDAPLAWESSTGYEEVALKISRLSLERAFTSLTGSSVSNPIEFAPAIDLSEWAGDLIARQVAALLGEIDAGHASVLPRIVTRSVEDTILRAMLLGLQHSRSGVFELEAPDASKDVVHRAEEFIEAHADEALTSAEIASACGVSLRSLQRAFRKHRDQTPMSLLRSVRLDRARERLLSASPHQTVTEIALSSGFGHLGEFAGAYRRRFGEPPSRTRTRR